MRTEKENATTIGVGVAACAACCAGPILGVLAAIGLGTAVGIALFGTVAIFVGAAIMASAVIRRRRNLVAKIEEIPDVVLDVRQRHGHAGTVAFVADEVAICASGSATNG